MATDPYSWAKEFAASQYTRAGQADADRMQMLLNVFQEEAARQRPTIAAPLELEMTEKKAAIQRRYQLMRDADRAATKAKEAKAGIGTTDPELAQIMLDAGMTTDLNQ